MLTKKLKKIGKECRKADHPVLMTLANYVDHVVNYLAQAEDDDGRAREYGDALTRLDLSAVVNARESLAVTEPTTGQDADTIPVESSAVVAKKTAKKAKKKAAKKEKKVEEAEATVTPLIPQEADNPAESPVENLNGEGVKKAKKSKNKAK